MPVSEVKWGIIGCGQVCEVKSGPAFSKIEHSELVAVMRRNAEKAEDYAARHNVARWYNDADKLINDPEVNAVYIATPPHLHEYYTKKVAAAGKPVYVEKPMARNHMECLSMIRACEDANVPLFVAYYRRMLPYFRKVKELIDSEVIGTVTMVSIQLIKAPKRQEQEGWRVDPEISGGGHFHDLASHQLDLLAYFFGDITHATGLTANRLGNYEPEDSVSASFQFENGLVGNGMWTFTSLFEHSKDEITIIGNKGRIHFCFFNDSIPITLETEQGSETFDIPYPPHVQQPLIQTIVDELRGKGTCPSTGRTGANTNQVIDQILS